MPKRSPLQDELLRLLRPFHRRIAEQPGERVRPRLAEIGRTHVGRPVDEIQQALEDAIREIGAKPDRRAVTEFAQDIHRGSNPFE